jgi:hypothetical protein
MFSYLLKHWKLGYKECFLVTLKARKTLPDIKMMKSRMRWAGYVTHLERPRETTIWKT